ncbi:MAG: outer membrane beta-barrel protein [Candidatus Aminicenantes bacterium]|nr:outer membrane beta-barrel protein [Candidatus Aminicenantes bacterium]
MRKISIFFLILSFCVFNLTFLGYASPKTQKENAQTETGEGQPEGNKGRKGDIEFSTAASLDIDRIKEEIDGVEVGEVLTLSTFSVPVRVGIFLTNNLEIEPEVIYNYMRISSDGEYASQTEAILLANVAYNFGTSSKVMPFMVGGAGITIISRSATDVETVSESGFAWNVGAGIKWFAANSVALRFEYRFISFSITEVDIFELKQSHTVHRIFAGISIFF